MTNSINKPLVSFILPVYNAAAYLPETLDSILRQTYVNFEILAINDGSSDGSLNILQTYAERDARIKVTNQKNKGLVKTLNESIKKAEGEYIARIDADDPSFESRIQLQMELFQKNDSLVLIGGGFEIIDKNGYFNETIHTPTRHEDILRTMMLRNPFGHAGVMFKKTAFTEAGGYSGNKGPTEDYDLWVRLSQLGTVANLPLPVYRYRILEDGISQSNSSEQIKYTREIVSSLWQTSTPRRLTRRELLTQAQRYLEQAPRPSYGIGLKEQFLVDNVQIGTKLVRHGKVLQGLAQIFAVASVGRSGLRAVKKQLNRLDAGSFKQILN